MKRASLIAACLTKRNSWFLCALLLTFNLFNFQVLSQKIELEQHKKQAIKPYRNSISISSFLLLGSVQLNYERLLGQHHGLMIEGYYAFAGRSADSWTLGTSYRYHFKPSLKGLFLNAFYRHGTNFNNKYKIKEDNNMNMYNLKTQLNVVGLGIGNRWQLKNGLAFVARGGYGCQINPNYKWSLSVPLGNAAKSKREAQLGLDVELSVGYSF